MEPTDLIIQTNGSIDPKIFIYEVKLPTETVMVAVIAPSATIAKEGLSKQIPQDSIISYKCVATKILQVQG